MIQFNVNITISMCSATTFSSDMTMISHFSITLNINMIGNPTFRRVLKSSSSFLIIASSFLKCVFHNISAKFASFDHTIKQILYLSKTQKIY